MPACSAARAQAARAVQGRRRAVRPQALPAHGRPAEVLPHWRAGIEASDFEPAIRDLLPSLTGSAPRLREANYPDISVSSKNDQRVAEKRRHAIPKTGLKTRRTGNLDRGERDGADRSDMRNPDRDRVLRAGAADRALDALAPREAIEHVARPMRDRQRHQPIDDRLRAEALQQLAVRPGVARRHRSVGARAGARTHGSGPAWRPPRRQSWRSEQCL